MSMTLWAMSLDANVLLYDGVVKCQYLGTCPLTKMPHLNLKIVTIKQIDILYWWHPEMSLYMKTYLNSLDNIFLLVWRNVNSYEFFFGIVDVKTNWYVDFVAALFKAALLEITWQFIWRHNSVTLVLPIEGVSWLKSLNANSTHLEIDMWYS